MGTEMETLKKALQDNQTKKCLKEIIPNLIGVMYGNTVAMENLAVQIVKFPFFLRDQIFWEKFYSFLQGLDTPINKIKFFEKMQRDDKNALRLISYIDKVEDDKKVQYILNATYNLLDGHIDLSDYFRTCNIISRTIEEDLEYLATNIEISYIEENDVVDALTSVGLMVHTVFDGGDVLGNSHQQYSFTPFAHTIVKYALNRKETID